MFLLLKVPQYRCIRKKYDTDKHCFFNQNYGSDYRLSGLLQKNRD